jgi:hypothetical protein
MTKRSINVFHSVLALGHVSNKRRKITNYTAVEIEKSVVDEYQTVKTISDLYNDNTEEILINSSILIKEMKKDAPITHFPLFKNSYIKCDETFYSSIIEPNQLHEFRYVFK